MYTSLEPGQISQYGPLSSYSMTSDGGSSPALAGSQPLQYLDLFHRSHPRIRVIPMRKSTIELRKQLRDEYRGGGIQADVVWGVASSVLNSAEFTDQTGKDNAFEGYRPAGLDDIIAARAQNDMSTDTRWFDRGALTAPPWVGTNIRMTAFCLNKRKIEAAFPTPVAGCTLSTKGVIPSSPAVPLLLSWSVLSEACMEGHVSMPDPTTSGTGFLALTGLIQNIGTPPPSAVADFADADLVLNSEGMKVYTLIDAKLGCYRPKGEQPCKDADDPSSPIWLGVSLDYYATNRAGTASPDLRAAFPAANGKGQSGWEVEANALVRRSMKKDLAREFLDWTLSEEAMRAYASNYAVVARKFVNQPLLSGYPTYPRGTKDPNGLYAVEQQLFVNNNLTLISNVESTILAAWMKIPSRRGTKTPPVECRQ